MNGNILDTNVITKLLDNDPAAISLVRGIDNVFTSIFFYSLCYLLFIICYLPANRPLLRPERPA